MYVCMYVCMCIYMYMFMFIYIYVGLLGAAEQESCDIHAKYNTTLVPCTMHVDCARLTD